MDPVGSRLRKGQNWCWHIDGYDKLRPCGFPIYACIDGFSRKIIWLELTSTNNDPNVVVKFFLDAVVKLEGWVMTTRRENLVPSGGSLAGASLDSILDGCSTPVIHHVAPRRREEAAGYRGTTPIEASLTSTPNTNCTETEVSNLLARRGTVPNDPPPPYRAPSPTALSHYLHAANMPLNVEASPPPYKGPPPYEQEIASQRSPRSPLAAQVPLPSAPPLDVIMDDNDTEDAAMIPMTAREGLDAPLLLRPRAAEPVPSALPESARRRSTERLRPVPPSMHSSGVSLQDLAVGAIPSSHLFQNASEAIVLSHRARAWQAVDRGCELSLYPRCSNNKDFSITEPLRIASKTGWTELRRTMFPLLSTYSREALVYTQLATFLLLLAFAITWMLADSQWTVVDEVNVALSGTATLIATINMAITTCMQRCLLVRRLLCCRRNDVHRVLTSGQCLPGMFIVFFDLSLILVSEILLFPIFICSMFRFLVAFSNANNYLDPRFVRSAIFFSLAGFSVILLYLLRILIVIFAFRAIQKKRVRDHYMSECCGCKSGTALHIRFVFHLLVQMILQILMTVMVGKAFYFGSINGKSTSISPALQYLIAGSFIIPLMGVLSFIVPNYYSIRRYSIAFFLNVLQPLVSTSDTTIDAERIVKYDYIASKRTCFDGYCYSIFHVMLAGFSCAYITLIIAFLVCYMLDPLVRHHANLYELISFIAILLGNAGVIMVLVSWAFIWCFCCSLFKI
ncbi:hypothetical protein EMCRGX_G004432 [Ephydatia muelleri]